MRYRVGLFVLLLTFSLSSCKFKEKRATTPALEDSVQQEEFDLSEIEESGELIVATLSGPESYYQYHGVNMGLQYLLAERYANTDGMRVRVEMARDTLELLQMLHQGKVDVIAYELPVKLLQKEHFVCAGVKDDSLHVSWAVRQHAVDLAESLNKWYSPEVLRNEEKAIQELMKRPRIKHSTRIIPFVARRDGTLSPYDGLFQRHAVSLNWDWRLLAAQSAQESAFDPRAVSWAGARGLMQVMPSTAREFGIEADELYDAEKNVAVSVKFLQKLQRQFADIKHPLERMKFVLAAYNGGPRHIRDAMALAQKHGRNSQSWSVVRFYVLHLSEPAYYRDPVVKNGYMIGSETYHYVDAVMGRWQGYRSGGKVKGSPVTIPQTVQEVVPQKSKRNNRFTQNTKGIIQRTDSLFR